MLSGAVEAAMLLRKSEALLAAMQDGTLLELPLNPRPLPNPRSNKGEDIIQRVVVVFGCSQSRC